MRSATFFGSPVIYLVLCAVFSASGFGFLFFHNGTEGPVMVQLESERVYYVKCPPSVYSYAVAKQLNLTAAVAREKCQKASGQAQSFNINEDSYLRSFYSLLGVPTSAIPKNPKDAVLLWRIQNEQKSRTVPALLINETPADTHYKIADHYEAKILPYLGDESHLELKDEGNNFPDSELISLVRASFYPNFFDGERAYRLANITKWVDGVSACAPGWAWAGRSILEETLKENDQSHSFREFWKRAIGESKTFPAFFVWEKTFSLATTPEGANGYKQELRHFSYDLNQGSFKQVQQDAQGFVLCIRRILPLGKFPERFTKKEAIFGFDFLAASLNLSPNELFQSLQLFPELSTQIEPLRRGWEKWTGAELSEFKQRIQTVLPGLVLNYDRLLAEEKQRQVNFEEALEYLSNVAQAEEEKKALETFNRFQEGNRETILRACNHDPSQSVQVWLAINWKNWSYTTYGTWEIQRARNGIPTCLNLYAGLKLNRDAVYVYAQLKDGSKAWGNQKKLLIRTGETLLAGSNFTLVHADTRSSSAKQEKLVWFHQWNLEGPSNEHVMNLGR